jgi:Uma2 family endonuclease
MSAPALQPKHWTRQEYDRLADAGILPSDERLQLIEGEIFTMTPQNSPHSAAIGKTEDVLRDVFASDCWVRVQMPLVVDPDSEPEPDLAVVSGRPSKYVKEHPRTALLVVEVADTTLSLDHGRKARVYASAGIQEYWIVNLADRSLEVYRDPVASSPGQPASYRSAQKLGPSARIAPLSASAAMIAVTDLLP